eukprot:s145_g29.t1
MHQYLGVLSWQMVKKVHFCTVQSKRFQRDLITYNAAMSAMARGGQWRRALALLEAMPQEMLEPDQISFNAALDACCKGQGFQADGRHVEGGSWESASCLLTMLQASGFQGTVITVNTALLACTKARQWKLASGWTDAVAQRSAGSTGEGRSASQPLPRWCKMTIPAQVMNPSDEASESPSANATCSGIPTFRS